MSSYLSVGFMVVTVLGMAQQQLLSCPWLMTKTGAAIHKPMQSYFPAWFAWESSFIIKFQMLILDLYRSVDG